VCRPIPGLPTAGRPAGVCGAQHARIARALVSGCLAGQPAGRQPWLGARGSDEAATRQTDRSVGKPSDVRPPGFRLPSHRCQTAGWWPWLCLAAVVAPAKKLLACISGLVLMRAARFGGLASTGSCRTCRGFFMRSIAGLRRQAEIGLGPGQPGGDHGHQGPLGVGRARRSSNQDERADSGGSERLSWRLFLPLLPTIAVSR
jgi:hypothetical protein